MNNINLNNIDLNELYLKHQKSLYRVAHKYLRTAKFYGMDFDDLLSLQHIGFMKAVKTYNGSKGSNFNSYLVFLAEQQIQAEMRSLKSFDNRKANVMTFSLNYENDGEKGEEKYFPELIIENSYEKIESSELLDKALNLIAHRKGAKVILLMKLKGYSNKEIAKKLNINEGAVAKRYSDLKIYLKKHLKIEHN